MKPTSTESPVRSLVLGSIVLALAMWRFGSTIADPDLWGHIRFGIDKIRAGSYISEDGYSYLTAGSTWFNHEWLGEVAMGGIYIQFGSAGLVIVKALLAAAFVVFLFWWLLREGIEPLRVTMLMVLNVFLLTPTLGTFRPQLFTTLIFTSTLVVLALYSRRSTWAIWLLPVLFTVWVNAHGGVLSGIVVVWVWAIVYAIVRRVPRRWEPLAVAAASTAALVLNPNGFEHVRFLVETTIVARPEIVEWQAVDLLGPLGIGYLVVFGLVAYSLVRSRSSLDLSLVVPLAGLMIAPLVAGRHLQLFVPATVILGGPYLALVLGGARGEGQAIGRTGKMVALLPGLLAATFAVGHVVSASRCLAIDSTQFEFPARGVAALASSRIEGNAVVPFNWGQYIIWHLGPEIQVSGDGRRETVYPEAAHRANLDFANGEGDWDRILGMAPTDAIIQATGTPGAQLIGSDAAWELAYQDENTTIYLPASGSRPLTGDPDIQPDGSDLCFPA